MRAYAVGRVERAERKTPEGKKPYVGVTIKEQDGEFTNWVLVKLYGQRSEEALEIPRGTLVLAEGKAHAFVTSKDGKTYANLSILGNLTRLEIGEVGGSSDSAAPKPSPRPAAAPKPAAKEAQPALNMDSEGEEPVPF